MIGAGLVILGAILLCVLAGVVRLQEPNSVVVRVRDDAARREESLRHRRANRGR